MRLDENTGKYRKYVLYVVTKSNWGGAQRYVFDMATRLPKDSFDVAVACGGNGPLFEKLSNAGIRVISLGNSDRDIDVGKEFKLLGELKRIFKEEAPDVVHLNSSKIGGIGAFAARLAGIKNIIYTAHGWAFNENRNIVSKFLIYLASFATILLAHKTITISFKEYNQALSLPFIPATKVAMIYIGLTPHPFLTKEESRIEILKHTDIRPGEKAIWIGSLGELHPNKGHTYALEAIKRLHDAGVNIFYCIIGDGELRRSMEQLITKHSMSNYTLLPGAIPTSSTGSTILPAFDIFLFPSTKEGLPFALLEAMSASVPVVSTNVGGIPEIIDSKTSGLLMPPKSADEIVAALEFVLYDERIRNDFVIAGKKKVQEVFSFEEMIKKTILEYELQ